MTPRWEMPFVCHWKEKFVCIVEVDRALLRASVLDILSLKLLKELKRRNSRKSDGKEVWGFVGRPGDRQHIETACDGRRMFGYPGKRRSDEWHKPGVQ